MDLVLSRLYVMCHLVLEGDFCDRLVCYPTQWTGSNQARVKWSLSISVSCGANDEFGPIMQQAFMEDNVISLSIVYVNLLSYQLSGNWMTLSDSALLPVTSVLEDSSDPMFSLGEFDVTVITYRHTLAFSSIWSTSCNYWPSSNWP